jgi:predicted PurR-regulated permease PerM
MPSEKFQRSFLLLLVTAVSIVFIWMIRNFLAPMLLAAIFSSLTRGLYLKFKKWTGGRDKLSSAFALTVFILVVILPLLGFVGIVGKEAVNVTQNVAPWVHDKIANKAQLNESLQRLPGYHYVQPYSDQVLEKLAGAVTGVGNFIFHSASALTAGTFLFLVNFVIMAYAMFFFYIDGPAILRKILYYMPLENRDEEKLLNGFQSMAKASIKGVLVIGAAQGAMAALALWIAGIPSVVFWGTLMAVFSVVPNVGSAIVWLPACIFLFIKGQTTAAILVFLWCAFVVGTLDNFLRPVLVGKDTQVHELLIFISTLGGLSMLGLSGFIFGPALALVFLTVWDIYGTTFKDVLPKVRSVE